MGSICEQFAVVTTTEEDLLGRNVLPIDFYFYYAHCSQIPLVSVSGLVGVRYRINELKSYYYTAQYIAHMTGGARTAVYVLKSRHVLDTFTSQLCRVSVCAKANFKRWENFWYI